MDKKPHPLRDWRNSQTPRKTLTELAGELSVTASHLSEIENWNNDPSLELTARMSRVTGIPMPEFVRQPEAAQ